jgi:hypothetical protein
VHSFRFLKYRIKSSIVIWISIVLVMACCSSLIQGCYAVVSGASKSSVMKVPSNI